MTAKKYSWANQMEEETKEDQNLIGWTVFRMTENRWVSIHGERKHKTSVCVCERARQREREAGTGGSVESSSQHPTLKKS
jgi:hypothetical protein